MSIRARITYLLLRRPRLKSKGIISHWTSFVCESSMLEGNNVLGKATMIHQSQIGKHTYIVSADIKNSIIGKFCSIGTNVKIGGLGAHPLLWISTHPIFYSNRKQSGTSFSATNRMAEMHPTTIGNDVWIGTNSIILDGVTIGDGAVIGAGAIVVKDVPPYAIVGGVPAKTIRFRFEEDVISRLLDWRWWNLSDEALHTLAERFCDRESWTAGDIEQLRLDARRERV